MKRRWRATIVLAILLVACFALSHFFEVGQSSWTGTEQRPAVPLRTVQGTIKGGETFFDIFKKNGFSMTDLITIKEAAASVHHLRKLNRGQQYVITADHQNCVDSLVYHIDDEFLLKVTRMDDGFRAEQREIKYERRLLTLAGSIEDNLVTSVGEGKNRLSLALRLSDIFAWDIDFASDLREGDIYCVVVEGLYRDGDLKKYGDILSAVFINEGKRHHAYRFEWDGKEDYFDANGNALRKAFLKAPLCFRRISSYYSARRFHPVLRTYRPHRGVDYAASRGTPVSTTADGSVTFAGRRGQYGKLVVVKHGNGYSTYYGHLARFARGIRSGVRVNQGDVIGYVGATGLATGPHLHYEMRLAGKFVNPLALKGISGTAVPASLMPEFRKGTARLERILSAAATRVPDTGSGRGEATLKEVSL